MTIVQSDQAGISQLLAQLEAGLPIIVPLPSPLPYVVVGTRAAEVNAAKGRPREQPVGVGVRSFDAIESALKLDAETSDLARWLCLSQGVGVLVPVSDAAPAWLAPATTNGLAFLGGVWLPSLAALLAGRTHVYMSSGNRTTANPAVTAIEAEAIFGDRLLIADGDAVRDRSVPHGSSTMIAVGSAMRLSVARAGINNRGFADDETFTAGLIERWRRDSSLVLSKWSSTAPTARL